MNKEIPLLFEKPILCITLEAKVGGTNFEITPGKEYNLGQSQLILSVETEVCQSLEPPEVGKEDLQ